LELRTFLPRFILVEAAKGHDSKRALALCSNLLDGEIALFDMAYITSNDN
jgi:hypothetical protein